jgi:hypothetical protein
LGGDVITFTVLDVITFTVLEGKCVRAGVKAHLIVRETVAPFMLPEPQKGAEVVLRKEKWH